MTACHIRQQHRGAGRDVVSILQGRSEEAAQAMSIGIRKCTSCLSNNKTTHGFVIEIELFGMLAELCFTRRR
jgi:hypothetical protein